LKKMPFRILGALNERTIEIKRRQYCGIQHC
jgi:hypothetical protein